MNNHIHPNDRTGFPGMLKGNLKWSFGNILLVCSNEIDLLNKGANGGFCNKLIHVVLVNF